MLIQYIKDQSLIRITLTVMLIALIAEAAVISYETFTSEESELTLFAEPEMNDTLQLRGTVLAQSAPAGDSVGEITFTLALTEDAAPVNFTMTADSNANGMIGGEYMAAHTVIISYSDADQQVIDLTWKAREYGPGDGDLLLEQGETFQITVGADTTGLTGLLDAALNPGLDANTEFSLDVRTPDGQVLTIKRTTPDSLTPVMNLY